MHHVFRPDDSRQVLEVGAMQPLHSTALGKVLAAFDPVAYDDVMEIERPAYTSRTVTDAKELEDVLAITRERGWACDLEETWEGLASVAAPITGSRKMPLGAVGVTGAVERVCDGGQVRPRLVAAVRDAARSISRNLGSSPF